ncbi:MAG: metalloregulator ArsR/SmtB family transcription factor [Thermodesulfobacteriota bacterium]
MEAEKAELFKLLGVESRIKIINLLKENGPLGVNDLAKKLGLTPAAVSQHMKALRQAGLVERRRQGYWVPYDLNPPALEQCGEMLASVCDCGCRGACRQADKEPTGRADERAALRRREQELQNELAALRQRLAELE